MKTTTALTGEQAVRPRTRWQGLLLTAPSVGAALLPKLTCPICLPAYTAALGAVGIGAATYEPLLFWVTLAMVGLAVGSLAYEANKRRRYGPALLGAAAGAGVLLAKFVFSSDPAMYVGAALLFGAALWNVWLNRKPRDGACCACSPAEPAA